MNTKLELTIYTEPVGKARARTVTNRKTGRVHSFTPAKTVKAEQQIDLFVQEWLRSHEPFERGTPIQIDIWAYLRPPASLPKKKHGRIFPTTRPDWDNYGKLVSDAIRAVWFDDAQVVDASVHKRYAWDGKPRWEIRLTALDEVQEVAA